MDPDQGDGPGVGGLEGDQGDGPGVGGLEEDGAAAPQPPAGSDVSDGPESCLDHSDSDAHEFVTFRPSSLPEQHYAPSTSEPLSSGLRTLSELLSWGRSSASPLDVATVPLAARDPPLATSGHRTLVSHDMMGGYLDDRFVQGTESEAPYAFYHWQHIDIFNYFTHNLVTVPPAVWINAAHRHGVLVMGTFITEWTEGAAVCEAFLTDEESYRQVADRLVQISHYHGFDGWLVNIENSLSKGAVRNTPLFLRYLTDQMHLRRPGSLVIWYDSVLEDGKLEWQNELNTRNRIFFDACDGLFTNYNWTESSLEAMGSMAAEDAALGGRRADVYVGVDVFARGEVVGGMLDTNKALKLIRKHNFSAAIFAPGWVYETIPDKTSFRLHQDKFWALLSDWLEPHRSTTTLPFVSSFCQGFGKALYWRGQLEKRGGWFNLSAQELQPLYGQEALRARAPPEEEGGGLRARGCPEEAWSGGSSLLLEGQLAAAEPPGVGFRVFSLQLPLPPVSLVTLVFKSSAGVSVSPELRWIKDKTIEVTGRPAALEDSDPVVRTLDRLSGGWGRGGWTVRCYRLELQDCELREVLVWVQREQPHDVAFSCRLGEVMVLDQAGLQAPREAVRGVCIEDVVWHRAPGGALRLSATLRWSFPPRLWRYFHLSWRRLRGPGPRGQAGPPVPLGRAYSTLFRLTELEVPGPPARVELRVEPVLKEGLLVPEALWGRRSLSYSGPVETSGDQ
ncbi:cytosolic endo-beta-N-acetylglucosaminidase isoform X1 [Gadus morhua]|uniref:mannosyl-glycoprotein endo-beta-N-acetylglucosaminidase n=2 Tax=Gadus morhua TaxID=8049 RepID=A0A8C5FCF4_GADMO|nr:cytosolic endo-beta-N-acetylglucosaminidase isoform X1 [Gadus morhua]